MAFGFGFGMPRSFAVPPFSPASLFANGEQGWWFDPSNFATLFQDSAGTTPVTAVEQPVGLQLDLSKGLVLGSDALGGNGSFPVGSYWGVSNPPATISGGQVIFSGSATTGGAYTNSAPLTVGVYYEISFEVVSITQGGVKVWAGTATPSYTATTAGIHTYRMLCLGDGLARVYNNGTATTAAVDNLTIKPVLGNHRFQTTSANRPVVSARVNLLTKTEQFDDAVWTTLQVSKTAAQLAPDGTATAVLVTGLAGTNFKFIAQTTAFPANTSGLTRIYIKNGTANFVQILYTAAAGTNYANFDISSGSLGNFSGAVPTIIQSEYAGWWLVTFTDTPTTANTDFRVVLIDSATTVRNPSTTTSTGTFYLWHPDLRPTNQGVNLPAYQHVNTSTDYDSTGFPVYIKPNGSNQFMQTNSINFTATDKMTVWQGVRKLSSMGTVNTLMELSAAWASNDGSFVMGAPGGATQYFFSSRGTAASPAGSAGTADSLYAAPITNVLTATSDISGDAVVLRLNSVQVATGSGDQGAGNFGNWPAYFYSKGGASLFFNGHDYGSIARGAASTAAQIANGEAYMAAKTGVTLLVETFDFITTDAGDQIVTDAGDSVTTDIFYS